MAGRERVTDPFAFGGVAYTVSKVGRGGSLQGRWYCL